ncbi:MAG: transglycosylase domain-containing protein [Patescibacteria group bacterium]
MKMKLFKKIKKKYLFLLLIAFIAFGIFIYFTIFYNLPSPYSLKNYKTVALSTHILDRNGKLLYEIYKDENRTAVKLNTLPKYVKDATVAIEDKDYYTHKGVSLVSGILRAAKENITKGKLQGGSTITQQLVKVALLSQERTIQRKVKEIVLAIWAERVYTKEEILELYLNQVSYGGNSYGVFEAAKTYFAKSPKDLTLAEAALLAGLPQAPSIYSPFVNPDYAIERRNEVLLNMMNQKYITEAQYKKAKSEKLRVQSPTTSINAPHFVFKVKQELEELFDQQMVEEGGLKVTTTLDLDLQKAAEKIVKESVEKQKYLRVSNGAALATRPPTGEIIIMVGSADYFAQPYGAYNVTTALRQPGSSIKPLNFAVGIDRKIVTAASVFIDNSTCFPGPKKYCPGNYDGKFHGPVQLRFALANSYNIPAVKMLQMNGVENFIASASAFGITSFKHPEDYGLSLTLGAGEVRMTEMAQAFSSFANRGVTRPLVDILKVEDKTGKILYEFKDPNFVKDIKKPLKAPNSLLIQGKKVLSPETAFIISHILSDNFARSATFGTGSSLVIPKKTVSVKTGTTDEKKDNLTIGYTANFLVNVWVGNNDNTAMNPAVESGTTGAAPIWNGIMKELLKNQPDLRLIRPINVVDRYVCSDTGGVSSRNESPDPNVPADASRCPTRFEYFIRGTEGIGQAQTSRQTIPVNKTTGKQTNESDPDLEMREQTVIKSGDSFYCVDCAH